MMAFSGPWVGRYPCFLLPVGGHVGIIRRRPYNVTARILDGSFDARSLTEGYVVVHRSKQENKIEKRRSAQPRFSPVLGPGRG